MVSQYPAREITYKRQINNLLRSYTALNQKTSPQNTKSCFSVNANLAVIAIQTTWVEILANTLSSSSIASSLSSLYVVTCFNHLVDGWLWSKTDLQQ